MRNSLGRTARFSPHGELLIIRRRIAAASMAYALGQILDVVARF